MPFIERLRAVVAILLMVGAALFIVGVAVERAAIANESSSAAHPSSTESPHHDEGSGTEGSGTEGSGTEAGQPATPAPESASETILGINVESWPLAIAAAILSVGIAFAAWRGRQKAILLAVAVFAVGFAALDIREVIHQASEGRTGIVLLASLIAVVHLAAAGLAALLATRTAPQAVTT